MKRLVLLCAAVAAIATSAPAWATKTFVLDGVTLQGGGTLTGTFTTDDALDKLLAVNITASASTVGAYTFSQFTYDNVAQANWVSLPTQGFQISTTGSAQQLRLTFNPLTDTGATILKNTSYEYQFTAGSRTVTGGQVVLDAPAAVPEPATWAMMIGGFGLIGAALRRRVRTIRVVPA